MSLCLLCSFDFFSRDPQLTEFKKIEVEGKFTGDNLLFDLHFDVQSGKDNKELVLFQGDFALIEDSLGEAGVLHVKGKELKVSFKKKGKVSFKVSIAVLKSSQKNIFSASFKIPDFQVRPVQFNAGKDGVELSLKSLINTEKKQNKGGEWIYQGFMKLGESFEMTWKPQEEKLDKELSMICQNHTVALIGVGSLKLSSSFDYRIVQGTANHINFKIPKSFNVTRIRSTEQIKDWQLIEGDDSKLLKVDFRQKVNGNFNIHVDGELPLGELPAKVEVGLLEPLDVLRASGFLALGTDSAIKILVDKTEGLTQVETVSFASHLRKSFSFFPKRSLFVYNFASLPVKMTLTAEKVKPVLFSDSQFQYSISDLSLKLKAALEVEVRDSAVRELELNVDPRLSLTSVRAAGLKDYEVVDDNKKVILYFRQALLGKCLLDLNFEWSHRGWQKTELLPKVELKQARTARGFISMSAAEGLLVNFIKPQKLRQVPVASLPVRSTALQSAWRFKDAAWQSSIDIKSKKSSLFTEVFHLYSLGENVIYGSVSITSHISGAPLDQFTLTIPQHYKNVELIGRHRPRLYKDKDDQWQVKLQRKISGDYTLLLTFEVNHSTSDSEFNVGGVELPASDSETGFITVSGPTDIKTSLISSGEGLLAIETDQIPSAYKLLHSHPVHLAFKYARAPHIAKVKFKAYKSVELIDQVVEHSEMVTHVNQNGERVTEVSCWIKNSSRQHLSLELPQNSKFWSCTVDGEKVRCTSNGDFLQIPVPRNSDPNKTIQVKYSYAEMGNPLEDGQLLKMHSPKYSVPGVFSEWKLRLPGGYSIYRQKGSMDPTGEKALNERSDTLTLVQGFLKWGKNHGEEYLAMFLMGLVIFFICWQIQQVRVFGVVTALILVSWSAFQLVVKTPSPTYRVSQPSYNVLDFKKTVIAAQEVQEISGVINDDSIVADGEVKPGILFFVLALMSLSTTAWFKNFLPVFTAMGLTWWGCRGSSQAEYYFALGISLLLPMALTIGLSRYGSILLKKLKSTKVAAATAIFWCFCLQSQVEGVDKVKHVHKQVDYVNYTIVASKKTATIVADFTLKAKKGERFLLIKTPCALMNSTYDDELLKFTIKNGHCEMLALKDLAEKVSLTFEVPITEERGFQVLKHFVPRARKNLVSFEVKSPQQQEVFNRGAIYFQSLGNNKVKAILKNDHSVNFFWRQSERKISEIPAVYFAETNSLVLAGEGSYDFEHVVNLKLSRGQINHLKVNMPEGQTVTSVKANNLSNWAFDPTKKQLELLFNQGIKSDTRITLTSQRQNSEISRVIKAAVPSVVGATRSYGLLAISGYEGVKVKVLKKTALQEIDTQDFPLTQFLLNKRRPSDSPVFSFSYMKAPVQMEVQAAKVKAELEVFNDVNFSIGDDRLVVSSRLKVNIKKAGVFELRFLLPAKYEVESLSAAGISHWDEATIEGQRQLILYFNRRVKGTVNSNLVLVQNAEAKQTVITVPKVNLLGEKRHRGKLLVSAEQGNRLEFATKEGLGAAALVNDGTMAMPILNKNWSLNIKREVLSPRIEVESLETINFADTRYQVAGNATLKIENAGTKILQIQAPVEVQNLEIQAKDIARTEKISADTWQLEFKRKIYGDFKLSYRYQYYYDSSQILKLRGVQFLGVDRQRGFLCLNIPSYMSGQLVESSDLQAYEPRLLPASLASPSDRKSTHCYRVLNNKWQCSIAFVRHNKAEILEANVDNVKIETMVSLDGRQLHVVKLSISGGTKNFLKMKLPPESRLCSVFSNGEPLKVSTQENQLMIPLNQSLPGESGRNLQIIYIENRKSFAWQKASFTGPQFDLPLKEIHWYLYVPEENKYDHFSGTMKHLKEVHYFSNSLDEYLNKTQQDQALTREKANELLEEAHQWNNSGRRDLARKNYEAVVNLSDSMSDINEDARIQLQTTLRQQTLVGLVNRRQNLKANSSGGVNDFDERSYNQGFFSDSFAKAVERTLEEDESRLLGKVSDKIMSQQAAAARQLMPLRLTLPKEGRQLHFYRQVQIEPMAPMNVSFETEKEPLKAAEFDKKTRQQGLLFGLLFLISFLTMGLPFKKRDNQQA